MSETTKMTQNEFGDDIYTNSYITQIIRKKNHMSKKMDSSLIPWCLVIRLIIYGRKVGYCLEQKIIKYEDHL